MISRSQMWLGCSDELTYGLARGYFVAEQEKRP
ncbi:hypothetical protein C962_00001, partial [Brucella melitensis CNGB 1076]